MPAPVIDSLGCVWYLTDYKGWAGSPAPRTNVIDREQSDGQFDGPAWQPGRQITLDGKVICPSNYVMHEAMDMFNALLVAGSRTGTMTAVEPHLTRQAVVRRDAENDFTPVGNTDALFSLILYAPDSNRYGSVLNTASTGVFQASSGRAYPLAFPRAYGAGSSAGTVTITNNGNVTTYPIITLNAGSGPMVNPSVALFGGLTLTFALSMNAGDQLVVDTGQRTVQLNTAARAWPLTSGTLGCDPGTSQYLFNAFSADPTATMSVAWRDAYA
jgi:hypothetical protein